VLFRESPISIHSVIAHHLQGTDPYENLLGDVKQPVAVRDGEVWSDYNLMSLVTELVVAKEDAVSLSAWSQRLARDWKETQLERVLYLALIHNRAHNYLQSIQHLTVYLKANVGNRVRVEFLKLLFPTPFSESILAASGGLDPLVVFGLIRQESAFNPQARSLADARGLMQLLPGTAQTMERIAPSDLYDPRRNVSLGSRYLMKLLSINNNHLESVLAAYNAGQRHIARWTQRFPGASDLLFSDLIPFRETRSYVSLIQRNSYWYGRLMRDRQSSYQPELLARIEESNMRSRTVDGLLRLSWGRASVRDVLSTESLLSPNGGNLSAVQ
jgi:soluble lytic murein transglycosylase-like protein